jgi:trehalose 6-phosphate phosphatase
MLDKMKPKYFFDYKYKGWITLGNALGDLDRPVFIFLDYDGTIVPIKEKPVQAKLPDSTRLLLNEIAHHPNTNMAIVSGRSMNDIRKRVKLPSLFFIANHGFEIYSKRIKWYHPIISNIVPILKKLCANYEKTFRAIHGVVIENKNITVSIHYRQLSGTSVYSLNKIIKSKLQMYSDILKLSAGKKVFEIKPKIDWNKGKAICKLLEYFNVNSKPIIIYMGDDKTDEDAFRLLPKDAFTIYVGRKISSKAKYYLRSPDEVIILLKKLNLSLLFRKKV